MPLVAFRSSGVRSDATAECERELLTLYESACHDPLDVFERKAVAQLGRLVGFDGAVWGRGSPRPGGQGVQIDSAMVVGRSERLFADYACTDEADPVARNFFLDPDGVQRVDVAEFYRGPDRKRTGECLAAHDISHLVLAGGVDRGAGGGRTVFSWLTAYRSDSNAAFAVDDAARYTALLPHWVQAREICAEISRARRPAPHAGVALRPARSPVNVAARGSATPSPREAEVLVFVARGFTYVETAELMGISRATVHSHVRNLYGKLGVHTKTEAVFEARALGWLE